MGLREQQKARRKRQILDAATRLIRQRGPSGWGMRELAQTAELSLRTPYNLFGSKGEVLMALVEDVIDVPDADAGALDTRDPVEAAYVLLDLTIDRFIANNGFLRLVMKALHAASDDPHPPTLMERGSAAMEYVLRAACDQGLLISGTEPGLVARQVALGYMGTLQMWSHGHLDDDGFRAHCRYGLTLCLLAAGKAPLRQHLKQRMLTLRRQLASAPAARAGVA